MKKYLVILIGLLFLAFPLYADVDTRDGSAITTTSDMDGSSDSHDVADGQTIKAGLSDWFTCDWSGSTDWTTEGVCGGGAEWDSCSGAEDSLSGGYGRMTIGAWANAHCDESYTNTSTQTIYVKFKGKFSETNPTGDSYLMYFYDGAGHIGTLRLTLDQHLDMHFPPTSTDSDATTTVLQNDTDYWIQVAFTPADDTGVVQIWVSTDATITSGEREVNDTTCDCGGTYYIDQVQIFTYNAIDATDTFDFDDFQWGDTTYEE